MNKKGKEMGDVSCIPARSYLGIFGIYVEQRENKEKNIQFLSL